jgi:DNA-binding NarL/FixJ family response regulator
MAKAIRKAGASPRVFLVDAQPVVLRGLQLLLHGQGRLDICGTADTVAAALEQIPAQCPDLAVVDLSLKGENSLKLIEQLRERCPEMKILVFSMHDRPSLIRAAVEAGAQGYVAKDKGSRHVLAAVQQLLAGKPYLPALRQPPRASRPPG